MGRTREIKGRIKAVASIQRITKTMQMIATARFQAAQKPAVAGKPYAKRITELVSEVAEAVAGEGESGEGLDHPLMSGPTEKAGRELVLVLTSSRGMCGAYNANLLRMATAVLKQLKADGVEADLEVVGKKGLAFFKFTGVPMAAFHKDITDSPAYEQVEALANGYMKAFTEGRYDRVRVIYMAFESAGRQKTVAASLLPVSRPEVGRGGDAGGKAPVDYDFSPGPAELLGELLPAAVRVELYQYFKDAAVSEHIARMIAMKQATDAAGKMNRTLKRTYNRARQAAITTELSEIISGAAALG